MPKIPLKNKELKKMVWKFVLLTGALESLGETNVEFEAGSRAKNLHTLKV